MTHIQVYGELMASESDRVKNYKLLPFGSKGRTNVGSIMATENSIEIPDDISHLIVNTEHDRMSPVGRFVQIDRKTDALYASVGVSKFKRGDEALAKIGTGELDGISVEIAGGVIKDGVLIGGELVGAALCKRPAFSEALVMASDTGELTPELEDKLSAVQAAITDLRDALTPAPTDTDSEAPAEEPTDAEPTDSTPDEEDPFKKGNTVMANTAVPSVLASSNGGSAEVKTFQQGVNLMASAMKNRDKALVEAIKEAGIAGEQDIFAALTPITSGAGNVASQAQWLGEAWTGKVYQRKYVPLLSSGTLTNWFVEGYRWVQKPIVGDYAGHPTQIPTAPVSMESFRAEAARLAGGNSIDLKYKHFGDAEFLQAYYRAQVEDYALKSDLRALAFIKASASLAIKGTVPTGVNATAAAIVDGALSMIDFATPSAALVPTAMYRDLLLEREDNSLKYLSSSLGLESGNLAGFAIVPSADVTDVHVIAKEAATFYELAGTPIRVEVDTPSNGGFDTALFGYTASVLGDDRGIVRVGAAPAPAA